MLSGSRFSKGLANFVIRHCTHYVLLTQAMNDYLNKTGKPYVILEGHADITMAPVPGPEVVTGSSRLKSGTAQKLVLNMLSTGAMVKTGKVVGNLMVNVRPTNVKLRDRCIRILMELGDCDRETAEVLIDKHGDIRKSLSELESAK